MRAVQCDVLMDSFGQSVEAVDDLVFRREDWASQCWMLKDDCVVDNDMLGGVLDHFVALVMVKGRSYVESAAAAEIPQASGGPLMM